MKSQAGNATHSGFKFRPPQSSSRHFEYYPRFFLHQCSYTCAQVIRDARRTGKLTLNKAIIFLIDLTHCLSPRPAALRLPLIVATSSGQPPSPMCCVEKKPRHTLACPHSGCALRDALYAEDRYIDLRAQAGKSPVCV